MLNKIKNRKQEGFTIIEVLIVLAIAGLIMLIVFLAVPALQRNSRNTSRRSEAGRYASAVSEFVANNNGDLPKSTDGAAVKTAVGDTKYYTANPIVVPSTPIQAAYTNDTTVKIVLGAECDGVKTKAATNGRQMALQYGLEPTGTAACQNI